jgi:hypothetical protein
MGSLHLAQMGADPGHLTCEEKQQETNRYL